MACVESIPGARITWDVRGIITRREHRNDQPDEDNETTDLSSLSVSEDLSTLFADFTGQEDDVIDFDEINPEDIIRSCQKGKCEFCNTKRVTKRVRAKVCVVAEIQGSGFLLTVTVNGKTVFRKEIDVANPPPICISTIPNLPLVDVCLLVTDVNIKDLSACVSISFKVKFTRKKINFKIGCFRIPKDDITDVTAADDVAGSSPAAKTGQPDKQLLKFLKTVFMNH